MYYTVFWTSCQRPYRPHGIWQ